MLSGVDRRLIPKSHRITNVITRGEAERVRRCRGWGAAHKDLDPDGHKAGHDSGAAVQCAEG